MKTQANKSKLTIKKYQISRIKNMASILGGGTGGIIIKTKPTTGGRL